MTRLRPFEIFLLQAVFYLALWIIDDYVATLLSLIIGGIALLTLLFSAVVEVVESSKVPRAYFLFLIVSVLAPLVSGLLFLALNGPPGWLTDS